MRDDRLPEERISIEELTAALADRYTIERELGAGGMATVYLAKDRKHHRQVAVKVLRPELAASLGPDRFVREITIAAGLTHPHILPLHDSGEAGGFLYYVMPYVEGESLRDRLGRERELPINDAVRIIREIVDALATAHARNVVHRDIKPDNIMVSGRHILVTDFGIAKAVSEATGRNQITTAGIALGTPSYMAPEQAAADPNVDHRADIYAVGALAYELLTGRPPFTGTTQQEILAAHIATPPDPVRKYRAAVPAELEAFVARCLEKKPADRWQSADEMLPVLEAMSTPSGGMTPTRGVAPAGPPVPWRRIGVAVAVAILVAAFMGYRFTKVGGSGTLIGEEVLAEHDLIVVAEFANATTDSLLGATVTDAIRVELQQSPVVEVLGQQAMWDGIRRMGLEPGVEFPDTLNQQLAQREGAKAYVTGDIRPLGAGYQLTARVVATVDGEEALTARVTAADDAELIGAVEELGQELRTSIGESLRSVRAAEPLARVTTASLPALRAYMAAGRAEDNGNRRLAIELAQQAVATDPEFASAWFLLDILWGNAGRYARAAAALEQAYRFRDRLSEGQRLRVMASYHVQRGEYGLAEETLLETIRRTGSGAVAYSDFLLTQRRFAEAESVAVEATRVEGASWIAYWNAIEAQMVQQRFAALDSLLSRMQQQLPDVSATQAMPARIAFARRDFDTWEREFRDRLGVMPRELDCTTALYRGQVATVDRCRTEQAWEGPVDRLQVGLALVRYTGDPGGARALVEAELERDRDASYPYPILIELAAEVGLVAEAEDLLVEWRDRTGVEHPLYDMSVGRAEAALAMADERFDDAAAAYLRWNRARFTTATHIYNRGMAEAANAYDRAGQVDSAVHWYERALDTPTMFGFTYEAGWYPPALRRLGELHDALGNREAAADYFRRFVDLWDGADEELQPQVAEARQRLARLAGENVN